MSIGTGSLPLSIGIISKCMEQKKGRIEWLDAMRGFTMLLVVSYHVAQMSYGVNIKASASLPFLVLFRMPLFFFVSGFVAYKSSFVWSAGNTPSLYFKTLRGQVIPALVFLCIFIVLRRNHFDTAFLSAMRSSTKSGYWFTWVLLQMFTVYYAFSFCVQRLPRRVQDGAVVTLWLLSIVPYELCYLPDVLNVNKSEFLRASSLVETMRFMHFFLLGNIVHRYWQGCQKVMDSVWFFPAVSCVAFLSCADIFHWHLFKSVWTNLPRTLAMYSLVSIVVSFFRYYQHWFTESCATGRALQYVGKRTLDVYLLHFILLPALPVVGRWLDVAHPGFLVELVVTLVPASVVICFCLLISNMLRISPFYRLYLFGRK